MRTTAFKRGVRRRPQVNRPFPSLPLSLAKDKERLAQRRIKERKAQAEYQMTGYDTLPQAIRRALQAQVVSIDAPKVRHTYEMVCMRIRGSPSWNPGDEAVLAPTFANALAEQDEAAVTAKSAEMLKAHGTPSPHVAARATILRP